jgi:hypothetical protein
MQTEEHNNGQRSPPSVPKTGPYLQRIIKVVLGCQTINGINPRSAIRRRQQQQQQQQQYSFLLRCACFYIRHCLQVFFCKWVSVPKIGYQSN